MAKSGIFSTEGRPALRRGHASSSLVGNHHAFLQHELELAHILDVLQRIAADHDQISQLADLDRAKLVAHAADRRAISGRGDERLPRCGAIADPQSQFEQRGILERPMSEPKAILTPALSALANPSRWTSDAASARQHNMRHVALPRPSAAPNRCSPGRA